MARKHAQDIKHIGLRVPSELWLEVALAAKQLRMTAQAFCIDAIQRRLKRGPDDLNGAPAKQVIDSLRKAEVTGHERSVQQEGKKRP